MAEILNITRQTDNPYINLYMLEARNKKKDGIHYSVASRSRSIEGLKLKTGKNTADGVSIYAVVRGEEEEEVVLVRQYRYSIDAEIYEFPAGLCEKGENIHEAAIREMYEETGLKLEILPVDAMYEEPRFTTIGMTDESVAMVYGYASGEVSTDFLEDTEELKVVLANRREVRRILREERVAVQCAYQLMHFLQAKEAFAFLRSEVSESPSSDV